jgi:hypothetical protein
MGLNGGQLLNGLDRLTEDSSAGRIRLIAEFTFWKITRPSSIFEFAIDSFGSWQFFRRLS